ncbi:MAG: glycosyltransferase family 4 protein [Elusimicrobia bacterium]|nr:glycosyltransferase family 4 protein [Elusimicrobiota bacterium]
MKLLVLGDLAGTGFGTVTMDLGRQLVEQGTDVRFLSLNEQPGELPEPFGSRTALLGQADGWLAMNDEIKPKLDAMFSGGLFPDGWAPEGALVIGDIASLKMSPIFGLLPKGFPAWNYVPVEGVGLPPRWAMYWNVLSPIAMSEFGAGEIEKVMGTRPPVVYHGVDTETFWKVSPLRPIVLRGKGIVRLESKNDCKRFFGMHPDRLLILRTDRHMPRKNYASLFRSLAPVLARHPDVDFVYHCRTIDQGGDLDDERSKYGPLARRMASTGFHDRYGGMPREMLNALYNTADMYVSVSAEGFGLTIAEAMACGLPVVAMDYSAVTEVVGDAGLLVPPAALTDNTYSHFWATVDEEQFGTAVAKLILSAGLRRDLGAKAIERVKTMFRWDRAAERVREIIGEKARLEVVA